jgi:hypothetical protein
VTYSAPTAESIAASTHRSAKWRRRALLAIGLTVLAAIVLAGFMAYMNPSMLLSLENLRLCY